MTTTNIFASPKQRHAAFAWYEMCGGMVTFNREHYAQLDESTIETEYAMLRD